MTLGLLACLWLLLLLGPCDLQMRMRHLGMWLAAFTCHDSNSNVRRPVLAFSPAYIYNDAPVFPCRQLFFDRRFLGRFLTESHFAPL